jgi:hypothetical protein
MGICLRNIPTFVGNSLNLMMLLGTAIASSPHLWGKLLLPQLYPQYQEQHPHTCGENENNYDYTLRTIATSPRAWGKYSNQPIFGIHARNIPTCGENFGMSIYY